MAATSLRIVRLSLAIAVAWLYVAGTASAHAAYEDSTPGNGETVSSPPDRVVVDFTERIVDRSRLSIFDPCGAEVDNNDWVVVNDRITVSMSADKRGIYTVQFAVQSAVDGHNTTGQFTFTSSGGSPCEQPSEEDEPEQDEPGERRTEERTRRDQPTTNDGEPREEEREARSARSRSERDPQRSDGTRAGRRDRGTKEPSRDIATGAGDLEANAPASVWEGIPMTEFLVALGVAALIGAAGGRIYAGIMGPVDRRSADDRNEP